MRYGQNGRVSFNASIRQPFLFLIFLAFKSTAALAGTLLANCV